MTGSLMLARALVRDFRSADVSEQDAEMLRYAVKLTREPWTMSSRDIERLIEAGFSDAAVLDICQVVSYYNYVNRLADGLGVELEKFWEAEELTVTEEEFAAVRASRRAGDGSTHLRKGENS